LSGNIFIVADLQGEKCRLSKIDGVDEIPVRRSSPFLLTKSEVDPFGNPQKIPLQIPAYIDALDVGDILVEGDGALLIEVLEKRSDGVLCAPDADGVLHPTRGIIVQKPSFRPEPMTQKDKSDLLAAANSGMFDAVAISFVSEASDIREAQEVQADTQKKLPIIAKIETQLGIKNIDSIAEVADALMAARGDLALTMPWVELYSAVSAISNSAKKHGTPWIVATQLAEGLERFVFPTRAEICDLANWISEGAHGAMLSYETAFGPRPVDAAKAVRELVDRYSI
jgi:pyruvate kinase